MKEALDLTP